MISKYLIELHTPKTSSETFETELETFAAQYEEVMEAGFVISVPDNPMGFPRFQLAEVIEELELPMKSDQVLMHVNTFHDKDHLDSTLDKAVSLGIDHLLVVSGDGSERLQKLEPEDLGSDSKTVTSIELLKYIHSRHPGVFRCGVAYNPYEPEDHENPKFERKLEAGAKFVGTQPVFGPSDRIDALKKYGVPVYTGIWLSKAIKLLADCLGIQAEDIHAEGHVPMDTLSKLLEVYSDCGLYISLLKYSAHWENLKKVLQAADHSQPAVYADS